MPVKPPKTDLARSRDQPIGRTVSPSVLCFRTSVRVLRFWTPPVRMVEPVPATSRQKTLIPSTSISTVRDRSALTTISHGPFHALLLGCRVCVDGIPKTLDKEDVRLNSDHDIGSQQCLGLILANCNHGLSPDLAGSKVIECLGHSGKALVHLLIHTWPDKPLMNHCHHPLPDLSRLLGISTIAFTISLL